MEWASLIVGLGGLALAGYTTYLNHKSQQEDKQEQRVASQRELLYAKQLEGYSEIFGAVQLLHYAAAERMFEGDLDDIRLLVNKKWEDVVDDYSAKVGKWSVYLPSSTQEKLEAYSDTLAYAGFFSTYPEAYTGVQDSRQWNRISDSYFQVIQAIREALGVDPLSHRSLDFFTELGREHHKIMQTQAKERVPNAKPSQ